MSGTTSVASLPYATLTDTADANALSQNLASALDHLVVPKYATTSARNAANASPTAGDMCYVTANGETYQWNGSVWVGAFPHVLVRSTNFSIASNNTTFTNDSQLSFTGEANSTYRVEWTIIMGSTTQAGNGAVAMIAPSGSTISGGVHGPHSSSTISFGAGSVLTSIGWSGQTGVSTACAVASISNTQQSHITLKGIISLSATSGTVAYGMRQLTSSGTNTTIFPGSYLTYQKIG